MTSPSNIQLQIARNGGAPQSGGVVAAFDDTIVLSLVDPSGVSKARYQIYEYPDGWTVPAGWTQADDGTFYVVTGGGPAPSFGLPSSHALWGKFLVDVLVDDGKRSGVVVSDLYDKDAIRISSDSGLHGVGYRETTEFDTKRQWNGELMADLRTIAAYMGIAYWTLTGGTLAPTTSTNSVLAPQGKLYAGITSAGLNYITGTSEAVGSVVAVTTEDSSAIRGLVSYSYSTANNSSRLHQYRARGTRTAPVAVGNGDVIASGRFGGFDGTDFVIGASYAVTVDGAVSTGIVPMKFVIQTMNTSGSTFLRTRWLNDGSQDHACDVACYFSWVINGDDTTSLRFQYGGLTVGTQNTLNGAQGGGYMLGVVNGFSTVDLHSNDASGLATTKLRRSRGTRSAPTAVQNNDAIGGIFADGYDGSGYIENSFIAWVADGAPSAGLVPMKLWIATGKTANQQVRIILNADGSQVHNADVSGTYIWRVNGAAGSGMLLSGGVLLVGTETVGGEASGSIAAVTTVDSAVLNRGLISYSNGSSAGPANVRLARSWNTHASPTSISAGVIVGTVRFAGYDGSSYIDSASIVATAEGLWNPGTGPMSIALQTSTTDSTGLKTRLKIDSAGSQTHNTDSGASYTWQINSSSTAQMVFTSAGKLIVGDNTAISITGGITSVGAAVGVAQHSSDTVGATMQANKSRGTRASPTAVASADVLGQYIVYGYDGTNYQTFGALVFTVDAAVSAGTVPTKATLRTGKTALNDRIVVASDGSQTHNTDASATYTWQINSLTPMFYSGGALYVGTTTTASEQPGSLVSVSTVSSGRRGLSLWQHTTDAVSTRISIFKSRGTRSAPTEVTNGDNLIEFDSFGYLGGGVAGYVNRGIMYFVVDAAPNNATSSLPTAWILQTGQTGVTTRITVSSQGAQTHNCDTGFGYTWQVNSANVLQVNTGNVFINSPVPLIIYDTESNTNPAKFVLRKDRAGGAAANGDQIGDIEFQGHDGTALRLRGQILCKIDGAVSNGTLPSTIQILAGASSMQVLCSFTSGKNLAFFNDGTANAQSMVNGVYFADSTVPTGNPASGHFYYSSSGSPAFRTSGGNIIVLSMASAATATAGTNGAPPAQVSEYMTITYNGNTRKIPLYNN